MLFNQKWRIICKLHVQENLDMEIYLDLLMVEAALTNVPQIPGSDIENV